MRWPTKGPRSFTLTTTLRPLRRFVTFTFVPNGNVGCAIVSALALNSSPLAVGRLWNWPPYQETVPSWTAAWAMPNGTSSASTANASSPRRRAGA